MNINDPITNPLLVEAMNRMKAEPNSENNTLFVAQMHKAHFLIPVTITPPPPPADGSGKTVLKEDTRVNFHRIVDSENVLLLPAFTDGEELRKWQNVENQQTMVMTFDDIAGMLLRENDNSGGFIINPYGQGFTLNRQQIANVVGRAMPYTVKKGTQIMQGADGSLAKKMIVDKKPFYKRGLLPF